MSPFPSKRRVETPLQAALRDAKDYREMYYDELRKNGELLKKLAVFVAAFKLAQDLSTEGQDE